MGTKMINPRKGNKILNSRHLKVLAAHKDDLKDSVVFVSFDSDKHGYSDVAQIQQALEAIDNIEPSGIYIGTMKGFDVTIYDSKDFKNKDIVVSVGHNAHSTKVGVSALEKQVRQAFSSAKSIKFIHANIRTNISP